MSFKSPELLIRPKRDYMSKRSHLQQTKKNVTKQKSKKTYNKT